MVPNVISEQDEQKSRIYWACLKRFIRIIVCIILIMVFVILAVLLFFADSLYHKPDLNELLARAKLAKLPESIQNLQVDTRPVMDNDGREVPNRAEMFVRFEARPNDIDNFIISSPGIDKDHFRPLRPLPDSDEVPTWWPTDDSSGRMYTFRVRDDINGMVAVYDDSNTVRICVWYIVNPQLLEMQENIEDMHDAFEDFIDDILREVLDLFD